MKRIIVIVVVTSIIIAGSIVWNQTVKQRNAANQQAMKQSTTQTLTNQTASEAASVPATCSGKALPELTEGPYYKAGSSEKQTIREETTPTIPLTLEGYVLDTDCKPIANAWIDFWQADGEGNYDNAGYVLRGYQYTDANGRYKLVTVVPGEYPGRTEHIHFKIKASENAREITSQLFLPGSSTNENDSIFDESLVMDMKDAADGNGKTATYNFVVSQ